MARTTRMAPNVDVDLVVDVDLDVVVDLDLVLDLDFDFDLDQQCTVKDLGGARFEVSFA